MSVDLTDAHAFKGYVGARAVALVTGAGRGIGRALVDCLFHANYAVVAVVRSEEAVAELASSYQCGVLPINCDVTEPSSEAKIGEVLAGVVSQVDLLINNAGFGASGYGIEGLVYQELERVINVNCYGPIRCIRACLPFLRKSERATIVNISSRFGSIEWVVEKVVPHKEATYAYRIAKAAQNMLTSCLAAELEEENIRVLAIDPGKVKTRFGPKDADCEPSEAAAAIVGIVQSSGGTGKFLQTSGEKVPW